VALEEAVRNVEDLEGLFALLRDELDWPVEPKSLQDDGTFSWSAEELRLDDSTSRRISDGNIQQLRLPTSNQPWGIFLVEFTDGHVYRTALRQVLRGLVPSRRRASHLPAWRHDNLLFICTTSGYDRFTFAHFGGKKQQKAKLATFGWQHGDEYIRTLCEYNLPALRFPEDEGGDEQAWLSAWSQAFDKEPLTREFFKCFQDVLEAVKADLEKHQPNLDKQPDRRSAQVYSQAQLLLERLIFCYFLKNRGWLAQDREFMVKHFGPYRDRPDEFSYYEEFLEKLFWSLASPPRSDSFRFSDVPFLNGGLFDDDEFDPKKRKNNPPLKVRNATFAKVFRDLLEAFNFTVCEDTPLDQDVAVDPEMLGKVFESIVLHAEAADPDAVAPDKRKATGSYYTPRIVVHFICREALLQWLKTQLGEEWTPRLKALFDIDPTDGLDDEEMDRLRETVAPAEGSQLQELLRGVTCCDPAVGSGAFPVGLLHELVNLRRVCEAAANGYVDPVRRTGTEWVHKTKEDIVENCLYGVDLQQQAVEICRLRLWLSLVVDYDIGVDPFEADKPAFRQAIGRISQLPNLEMNFHRGDSLHGHVSGVPVIVEGFAMRQHQREMEAIRKLGTKLHHAKSGERKRKLRVEILQRRFDLTEAVLKEELRKLRNRDAEIAAVLFQETTSDAEKRRRLAEEIEHAQRAIAGIQDNRRELGRLASRIYDPDFYPELRRLEGADFDSPFNFSWRLDFPSIFGREPAGFDIVVGNPPFVTARNPEKRELYRARWPVVCYRTYQLLAPFFQRSFGLLSPGGQLGFIVSNAFATRDFGKPLIEQLLSSVCLQKVVDCSGLMFPGHGTPTCIVLGQAARSDGKGQVCVVGILPGGGDLRTPPEQSALWHAIEEHHDAPGYIDQRIVVSARSHRELARWPWRFDVSGERTKQKIEAACADTLSSFLVSPIGRILATSANDIYQVPPDLARRTGLELEVLAAFSHGEEVRDWHLASEELLLKPYDSDWNLVNLHQYPRLAEFMGQFREQLGARRDFSGDSYDEAGRPWYEYHQLDERKVPAPHALVFPLIATHYHAVLVDHERLFDQHGQIARIQAGSPARWHLAAALANSACALFWLKQFCYNRGAGQDEERDRFEFAGGKVEQLPVAHSVAQAMEGNGGHLTDRLMAWAESCWQRACELQSHTMRRMFEKPGEAYSQWNASLPCRETRNEGTDSTFSDSGDLRATLDRVIRTREGLRRAMIARQEEMDWLVYQAYGLIEDAGPALPDEDLVLAREERPFCLWQTAEGEYDEAIRLIPADWSDAKRELWRKRLQIIRDNEHVRRIEQPVYKRRWDEQYKIGNRWECGQPAYDAEFLDAFDWWLSEKAEWHLEHKAQGAMTLAHWTTALWNDTRVQAAWQVAAEAGQRLEAWKEEQKGDSAEPPELDASRAAFARHFKKLVKDQAVPEGIPFAVPWDELKRKKVRVPASVRRIRGKLNVPRERFWITEDGAYRQAQPLGPVSGNPSGSKPAQRKGSAGKGSKGNFKLRSATRTVTGRLDMGHGKAHARRSRAKKAPARKAKSGSVSINDFDRDQLKDTLLEVVGTDWTERDDAIRAAARSLGFKRTGKRIQAAFKSAITGLLRQHRLESDGSEIRRTS